MELSFGFASNRVNKRQIEISSAGLYYKSQTLEVYLHREPGLPPAPHLQELPNGSLWQAFGWELIIERSGPQRIRGTGR